MTIRVIDKVDDLETRRAHQVAMDRIHCVGFTTAQVLWDITVATRRALVTQALQMAKAIDQRLEGD